MSTSTAATNYFLSDQEWIEKLLRQRSTKRGNDGLDPTEQRWGFLEPEDGNGPTLDFPRGNDAYNVIVHPLSSNLTVVPGDVEIRAAGSSTWNISFHEGDGSAHTHSRVPDGRRLVLRNRAYIFHDTINPRRTGLDGAFVKYDTVPGCFVESGGFGTVTKVFLRSDPDAHFALKVVRLAKPRRNARPVPRTYEISALKALKHPNICRMYEAFATRDNSIHIIMEFAELGSLNESLQTYATFIGDALPLKWEVFAGSAIYQICSGVQHMHSLGIIHRDIKSGNIVRTSKSPLTLKIIDFGLATRETKPTLFCGTCYFMAPEVMTGPSYDNRVDLYSIGVIALDILLLMYHCESPYRDWWDGLKRPSPNAENMIELATARVKSLTTTTVRNANGQALQLVGGLLVEIPSNRITIETALDNPWALENHAQRNNVTAIHSRISAEPVLESGEESTISTPVENATVPLPGTATVLRVVTVTAPPVENATVSQAGTAILHEGAIVPPAEDSTVSTSETATTHPAATGCVNVPRTWTATIVAICRPSDTATVRRPRTPTIPLEGKVTDLPPENDVTTQEVEEYRLPPGPDVQETISGHMAENVRELQLVRRSAHITTTQELRRKPY